MALLTFCRKKFFHAYVYKLDGQSLDLVHSHSIGPQNCKHNARMQYLHPNKELSEGNGDSDLELLNETGDKITRTQTMV